MPYDGLTTIKIIQEMNHILRGSKAYKIYQPLKDEIIIYFSNKDKTAVRLSANASFARVNITGEKYSNSQYPPPFCMLLRKYLTGAVLKDIRQINPLKIKILSENQNKNDENEGTMDALRFLEEYNRMKLNDPKAYDYIKNIADNESLVEYVIKWSKDNPPKTRLQEFLEKYPNAILKNGVPERLCPYDLGYKVEECFGSNNCLKCWNKPV